MVNLRSLIAKLNETARGALEGAAGLCLSRTHYDIEIEHYVLKLMDAPGTDIDGIFKAFDVDRARVAKELGKSLDKLKSGNARTPAFSPSVVKMLQEAWTLGSLDFEAGQVRSGFTILALVSNEELSRIVRDVSKELAKIEPEALRKEFAAIVSASSETTEAAPAGGGEESGRAPSGKSTNLDQYTVDLTANARAGKIDPVLGRDAEIRQIVDILTRRGRIIRF